MTRRDRIRSARQPRAASRVLTPSPPTAATGTLAAAPIPELVPVPSAQSDATTSVAAVPLPELAEQSAAPAEVTASTEAVAPDDWEEWVPVRPDNADEAYHLCRPGTGWHAFAVRETATGLLCGSIYRTLEEGEQALAAAADDAEPERLAP